MFGSGDTQAQTQTVASGVDIQSSCYGGVVPVIYGRARLTGNLVWYGDFQAIPVQSSSGNGGKGGDSNHGSTSYDYKASFIFALGEGPLGRSSRMSGGARRSRRDGVRQFRSGRLYANRRSGAGAVGLPDHQISRRGDILCRHRLRLCHGL